MKLIRRSENMNVFVTEEFEISEYYSRSNGCMLASRDDTWVGLPVPIVTALVSLQGNGAYLDWLETSRFREVDNVEPPRFRALDDDRAEELRNEFMTALLEHLPGLCRRMKPWKPTTGRCHSRIR